MVVDYDERARVLYVKREDAVIKTSREAQHDGHTVVHMDASGDVVGFTILDPLDHGYEWMWRLYCGRAAISSDLADAVTEWLHTYRPVTALAT